MSKRLLGEDRGQQPWKRKRYNSGELHKSSWKGRGQKEAGLDERWEKSKRGFREEPDRDGGGDLRINQGTWSTNSFKTKDKAGRSEDNKDKSWSRVKSEREGAFPGLKREKGGHPSPTRSRSNKVKGETSNIKRETERKVRDQSVERLLKMKEDLFDEDEIKKDEDDVEFELFKARVIRKKMLKEKGLMSMSTFPERKVPLAGGACQPEKSESESESDSNSTYRESGRLIKTEMHEQVPKTLERHQSDSSSSSSEEFGVSDLAQLMKLSKLKKRKKRSQKKRSKDKSRKAKKTKNILAFFERDFGSEDSSDEELLKSLKRGRKKKIRSHKSEKGHGRSDNSDVEKSIEESSVVESRTDIDVEPPEIKEEDENLKPVGTDTESKSAETQKQSNASLEAIKRILNRKVEVEVVELDSDDDVQEVPLCFQQAPRTSMKKIEKKKRPNCVENVKQEQEVVTLDEPEEANLEDVDSDSEAEVGEPPGKRETMLVFVDIETNSAGTIDRIEILTPSIEGHRWLSGKTSEDLAMEFIKHVKETCRPGQVLVVACLATFDLLLSSVCLTPQHVDALDSLFSGWLDLASLQVRLSSPDGGKGGWLVARRLQASRVDRLLASLPQQQPPCPQNQSKTDKMTKFLAQLLEERKTSLEPLIMPFSLPSQSYLVVVLHVATKNVPVSDSHQRPVITGLGFKCSSSLSHHYISIKEGHGQGEPGDKTEKEALESFIACVRERRDVEGEEGVLILTPRLCQGLPLLLAALARHRLMQEFQELVDGLGSIEDLAVKRRIMLSGETSLGGYKKYYFKRFGREVDLREPAEVAPAVSEILEELLLFSKPTFANCLSTLCHPLVSGFTMKLLGKTPYLQEGVFEATVNEKLFVKPGDEEIVSVLLGSAPTSLLGREFVINSYGIVNCVTRKAVLDEDYLLLVSIKNLSSEVLCLEKGVPLGLASLSDESPFTRVERGEIEKAEGTGQIALEKRTLMGSDPPQECSHYSEATRSQLGVNKDEPALPKEKIDDEGSVHDSRESEEDETSKSKKTRAREKVTLPTLPSPTLTNPEEPAAAVVHNVEPSMNEHRENPDMSSIQISKIKERELKTNIEELTDPPECATPLVGELSKEPTVPVERPIQPVEEEDDEVEVVQVDSGTEDTFVEDDQPFAKPGERESEGDSQENEEYRDATTSQKESSICFEEIPNDEPLVFDVESDEDTLHDSIHQSAEQGNKDEIRERSNTDQSAEQGNKGEIQERSNTAKNEGDASSMGTIGLEIVEETPSSDDDEVGSITSSNEYFALEDNDEQDTEVANYFDENELSPHRNDIEADQDVQPQENQLGRSNSSEDRQSPPKTQRKDDAESETENEEAQLSDDGSNSSVSINSLIGKKVEDIIFDPVEKGDGEEEYELHRREESPPRRTLGKCPSSSISYSHSPLFISSILRQSMAHATEATRLDAENISPYKEDIATSGHIELNPEVGQRSPEYPVLHLVEDPGTGAVREADEADVDADLLRLASEAGSKGAKAQEEKRKIKQQDKVQKQKTLGTKEKGRTRKEDWVVGRKKSINKKTIGSCLPRRRSERVFIKDSAVNYAEVTEEERKEEENFSSQVSEKKKSSRTKEILSEQKSSETPQNATKPQETSSSSIITKTQEKDPDHGCTSKFMGKRTRQTEAKENSASTSTSSNRSTSSSSTRSTSTPTRKIVQEDQNQVIVSSEKRQTSSKGEKTKEKQRSQMSKECSKSKRKKEGKMSKEFLSSLGLFDPIGAMAGVVRMSTGPLKTQDDEPIKTDEPVDNAEQIPRSSTIKSLVHDRPLVPQLVQLARDLPHLDVDQHQDLALHFPSLLAVPQLEQVVRVFLRFHQRSPEDLSKTERQFADLLVTELHCSNIKKVKDLEEVVADVYKRRPDSTMDGWIREITLVNPGLESMALVDQMELCFDLDVAMQILLLCCLPFISAMIK